MTDPIFPKKMRFDKKLTEQQMAFIKQQFPHCSIINGKGDILYQPQKTKALHEIIEAESGSGNPLSEGMKSIDEYLLNIEFDKDQFSKLDKSVLYKSTYEDTHDETHIERVVLLGSLLSSKEGLAKDDFALLLPALKYHDIGRIDDDVDDRHGQRGADRIKKLFGNGFFGGEINEQDIETICNAVTLHSIDDERWPASAANDMRLHKLASLLKDADNLDRVRLYGGVNPKYLRSRHAEGLIPFAKQLYQNYRQNKYLTQNEKENL